MRNLIVVSVLVILFGLPAVAQQGPCTEQTIRHSITTENDDSLSADDLYLFSAAFDKPIVGKTELEKARGALQAGRTNEKHGPWQIERIVVAPSADMAYEYGTRDLSFDEKPSGKHLEFTNAYLRVWKAVSGSCKVAAIMYEREGHP